MNIAGILEEDIVDSDDGMCISVWFNGCDIRCKGCHNKTYWDIEVDVDDDSVIKTIEKYYDESVRRGIPKSLSILGGEPLSKNNRKDCAKLIKEIITRNPEIKIRMWTGRTWEQLVKEVEEDESVRFALDNVDQIIIGPFIEELKANLPLRGSTNQEVLYKGGDYFISENKLLRSN